MVVMGQSGSGKSTFLQIAGLLDTPSSGHVVINGRDTASLKKNELADVRLKTLGFVFQAFHLNPHLRAYENVMLPMLINRDFHSKKEMEARAKELIETVGLKERMNHYPGELSGGEQQRVAIARALINKPKILLADEPTGNLDANNAWEIMKLMEEINEQGTTVVVVTHNLEIVKAMNKRVITMQKGVVVDDTASDHYGKDTSVEQDDDLFDDFLDDGGDDDYAN